MRRTNPNARTTVGIPVTKYIRAVEAEDGSYDGKFVFGRISDRIFCKPSCGVFERGSGEIRIFSGAYEAKSSGYLPCPQCSPDAPSAKQKKIETVEKICDYIRQNPSSNLSLADLERQFGMGKYSIQKMFKEVMGISPRKYVEECRIMLLKRNLRNGEPLPGAVYKTGYNSQSWLYEDPSSKLGMTPSSYRKGGEGAIINFLTAECSLGFLIVAETEHGICALSIGDSEEALEKGLRDEFPKAILTRSEKVRTRINSVLNYFDGQRLSLPLDVIGTDFQMRVWSALRTIPYGETRSYNEVAGMIGMPKAYRAVANACAANHVPLIVPCHRVVRKDGSMGGYALGTHRKKFLLEMEKENAGREQTGS